MMMAYMFPVVPVLWHWLVYGLFAPSFIGGASTATTPPTNNSKACKTQKTLVLDSIASRPL